MRQEFAHIFSCLEKYGGDKNVYGYLCGVGDESFYLLLYTKKRSVNTLMIILQDEDTI